MRDIAVALQRAEMVRRIAEEIEEYVIELGQVSKTTNARTKKVEINKKGKFKVLHPFTSDDGSEARGNLYRDKAGNFYGTALFSGARANQRQS